LFLCDFAYLIVLNTALLLRLVSSDRLLSQNRVAPIQSGVSSVQPFGNIQGSWKCTSDKEITATTLNFNYPTTTLPGTIGRGDFRATFDPKNGTVQATATLRFFDLNANPLSDDAPVSGTFIFTGQRVKAGQ